MTWDTIAKLAHALIENLFVWFALTCTTGSLLFLPTPLMDYLQLSVWRHEHATSVALAFLIGAIFSLLLTGRSVYRRLLHTRSMSAMFHSLSRSEKGVLRECLQQREQSFCRPIDDFAAQSLSAKRLVVSGRLGTQDHFSWTIQFPAWQHVSGWRRWYYLWAWRVSPEKEVKTHYL